MFSVEFLNQIRAVELSAIAAELIVPSRILEIGGGTGVQARALEALGHEVKSVDLQNSVYADARVFPIIDYDGHRLPFPENCFDVVLSSNVLEHIADLEASFEEFERVLVPGGIQVHVMPTGVWRFLTIITGYLELLVRLAKIPASNARGIFTPRGPWVLLTMMRQALSLVWNLGVPRRHGERGTAISEIWTFSRVAWLRWFARNAIRVEHATPMKLLYSGHMLLAERLSLESRRRIASVFGSSCVLYRVGPSKKAR